MKMFLFLKALNESLGVASDNFVANYHNQKLALALIWFLSTFSIIGSVFGIFGFIGLVPISAKWPVLGYSFMTILAMISPYTILWCFHCMNNASWHFYQQTMNE